MAAYAIRLRRAMTAISAVNRHLSFASHGVSAAPAPIEVPFLLRSSRSVPILGPHLLPRRSFRSSAASLSARGNFDDLDKIDPDTILFEGCDYNHWLITMDFPKDPKPTPEEMVRTYEETCAKGLKISLEEAKQRMYACSTTTYQGFQAVMTEAESEQFRDIPGVVFILPDSYIDPQNKEYGGDKYENGVITPRPPPIQYGRQRPRDRNRDMPRYDRDGRQMRLPQQQYNNTQGDMQRGDDRNYGPPQNYPPRQNYGPPGQGDGRNPMPNNIGYNPDGRGPPPPQQSWGQPNTFYNQEGRDSYPGNQRNYAPRQNDFRGNNMNYAPNSPGGSYEQRGQGGVGYQGPGAGGSYVSYGQGLVHNNEQGQGPNYGQGQVQGGPGYEGRGMGGGYGQGQGPDYGRDDVGQGQGEGSRNVQGDQGGYGQGSPNQGRY